MYGYVYNSVKKQEHFLEMALTMTVTEKLMRKKKMAKMMIMMEKLMKSESWEMYS